MKYRIYFEDGHTIIVKGMGKVVEAIMYHNAIGFRKV